MATNIEVLKRQLRTYEEMVISKHKYRHAEFYVDAYKRLIANAEMRNLNEKRKSMGKD